MSVIVDTSAVFALLDEDDHAHRRADEYWRVTRAAGLITHAYVVSESIALLRLRMGWAAVEAFLDAVLPLIRVQMVDRVLHDSALTAFRAQHGGTSFVDHVTIAFARREGITEAFAFDRDLEAAGLAFPNLN